MSDDAPEILVAGTDPRELVHQLQPLCDLGLVCDVTMRDATAVSAVLVGVSSTALIVDRWDSTERRPAGDPYVMPLAAIDRVAVP